MRRTQVMQLLILNKVTKSTNLDGKDNICQQIADTMQWEQGARYVRGKRISAVIHSRH